VVIWQTVLDVIDAVESWIAGQSYWVQVVLLLAVLGPLCYLTAGLIDRAVEAVLAWHSRRDQPSQLSRTASGGAKGMPSGPSPLVPGTSLIGSAPARASAPEQAGTDQAGTDQAGTDQAGRQQITTGPAVPAEK